MVEYWNVGLNREVTHLLTSLSRAILSIDHFFQELFTHYSITPVFQHSNCERSELSSLRVSAKICVPSYLRLMFVGQPAKFMGMDVGVGHQCLIKRNLPIGHGIHPVCAFREEIQVMGNKNA